MKTTIPIVFEPASQMKNSVALSLTLALSRWERELQRTGLVFPESCLANTVTGSRLSRWMILPLRSLLGRGEGRGEVRVGVAAVLISALTLCSPVAHAKLNVVAT